MARKLLMYLSVHSASGLNSSHTGLATDHIISTESPMHFSKVCYEGGYYMLFMSIPTNTAVIM